MIRITKPAQPPAILDVQGKVKRAEHCADYALYKAEYDTGKRRFTFHVGIYGHATVKDALIAAQHGKCCFCERRIGDDGDVEHFRPKSGCRQTRPGKLLRPGYYWLAYEWDNLFLCCSACNQRHKRNHFPLANPDQRAVHHSDDVSIEQPLFLNPSTQDPEQFIGFRNEIPFAIDGNKFGKATITALALDREILTEVRRDHLAILIQMQAIVKLEGSLVGTAEGRKAVRDAKAFLARAVTDKGEFAAMARAAAATATSAGETPAHLGLSPQAG